MAPNIVPVTSADQDEAFADQTIVTPDVSVMVPDESQPTSSTEKTPKPVDPLPALPGDLADDRPPAVPDYAAMTRRLTTAAFSRHKPIATDD